MLIVTDLSEAVEEFRNNRPSMYCSETSKVVDTKPEGWLIELADAVIRIADYVGLRKESLTEALRIKMAYNKTRPYRHGNKRY